MIDLWVIVLATSTIVLKIYDGWEEAGVRRDHQIYLRICHTVLSIGMISLFPAVVTVGLGATLSAAQFFSMWAFSWLFMTTFGLIIIALFRSLGPGLGGAVHGIFLILNLVSSSATTSMELMPAFFRIGYGLPFYQAVCGLRTILFGSYNHLGRNVGVLFAWLGLCGCLAMYKAMKFRKELLQGTVPCTVVVVVGA